MGNLMDGLTVNRDRQGFRAQTSAGAGAAGNFAHILLNATANVIRFGLLIAAFQVRDDAFIARAVGAFIAAAVGVTDVESFAFGAIQNKLTLPFVQIFPRGIERQFESLSQAAEHIPRPAAFVIDIPAIGVNRALGNAFFLVRYHHIGVDFLTEAQSLAGRAGAAGGIEAEEARFGLRHAAMAMWTGQVFAEQMIDGMPAVGHILHNHTAVAQFQRGFNRIRQTRFKGAGIIRLLIFSAANNQAVDDDFNIMDDIPIQFDVFIQIADSAVHPHPRETLLADVVQDFDMIALLAMNNRRKDLNAAVGRHILHLVNDLLGALR